MCNLGTGAFYTSGSDAVCTSRPDAADGGRYEKGPVTGAQSISCGGDEGDRTLDLLDATEALSQLSYVPRTSEHSSNRARDVNDKVAENFTALRPTRRHGISRSLKASRFALRTLARHEKTAPHFTKMNPPLQGGCPHRSVPASLTTKDSCTALDFSGSLNKRDGSPSCSAGGGTLSS